MTTMQALSFLIGPIAGVLIAAWAVYYAKHME